jgi:uncharacterized protein YndB with AHSA1/START domain
MTIQTEKRGRSAPHKERQHQGESIKKDLFLTKLINVGRETVWKAWTDSRRLQHWWGPHGFTNPRCELDLRLEGAIRIDMRGPDGIVYPMSGFFREITPYERLSFVSSALDEKGLPLFEVLTTVTFADTQGQTALSVRATASKLTPQSAPYLAGMEQGWTESLVRLSEFVTQALN